jgi:hypothetical protein
MYTAAGELDKATDAASVFHSYGYHSYLRWPHYLKHIADAALTPTLLARHEHNDDGHLTAAVDANNKGLQYTHDAA